LVNSNLFTKYSLEITSKGSILKWKNMDLYIFGMIENIKDIMLDVIRVQLMMDIFVLRLI